MVSERCGWYPRAESEKHRQRQPKCNTSVAPHGSFIGLPLCAWFLGPTWVLSGPVHMGKPYTSHTEPIWACYMGHTCVLYGRVHMGLSVRDSYGSFVGLPIWASPYTSDTGPTWAWYLGPTWVLCRLALMSKPVYIPHCAHMGLLSGYIMGVPICVWPYWTHMGPIWACPYWQARIHRTQGTSGLAVLSPHGFFMSLPLCACYLGPTWVLYGVDHMGKPYTSHTVPIWACYLGPTWVFYGKSGIHPTLGPYGIAIWAPHSKHVYITHGSFMGVPILA